MGTVRTCDEPRRLGQRLDAMSPDELARLDDAVIALDADGHIVAITPAAARWIGVAAWQARGRTLTRELAWRFGKAATAAIAAFSGDTAPISTVHAAPDPTHQRPAAAVALVRGDRRIYLALAA
ncbi:MAG: hypothetical protein IPH44_37780 [Myxococcales bacterium]|nr:hypothetical protein [Myxococcales bacterium]MBK7197049.1 hypothetical protein [Myxococcales bacterium]MBP6846652.1 hypothetical protein [Kofleriaceae bacterium]